MHIGYAMKKAEEFEDQMVNLDVTRNIRQLALRDRFTTTRDIRDQWIEKETSL